MTRSLGLKAAAGLLVAALSAPIHAAVVNFSFDNTANSTVTAPFVGSGTLTFDGPAAAGTFALASLTNFVFDFTVGGVDFGNADLGTPVADVLVQFTTSGSDLVVNFGGARGGPFAGSLDFLNASGGLSFQPDFGSLYFASTSQSFGTYAGVVQAARGVPEPGSLALVAAALLGASALRRKVAG